MGVYFHGRPNFYYSVMALDRDHRGRNVTNKTAYGTALSFATNVCSISMDTAIHRADEQLADWLDSEL